MTTSLKERHKPTQLVHVVKDASKPHIGLPLPLSALAGREVQFAAMPDGCEDGSASVFVQINTLEGPTAVVEFPLHLLLNVADILRKTYGKR